MKQTSTQDTGIGPDSQGLQRLPEYLPVGTIRRRPAGDYKAPCEVKKPQDLPTRLLLGDLVVDSFVQSGEGWSVRYQDADPGTYVDLSYTGPKERLVATLIWQGEVGMRVWTRGRSWKEFMLQANLGFPENWDRLAGQLVTSRFNVRWLAHEADDMVVSGFPDGALQAIAVPVPHERLPELLECLERMENDPGIGAAVTLNVVLMPIQVDYKLSLCPDVPAVELVPKGFLDEGAITAGLAGPIIRHAEDGDEYASVVRMGYVVHASCFFRDLLRVLAHLHAEGFIGVGGGDTTDCSYPQGGEWAALVMPGGQDIQAKGFAFCSPDLSRRIRYGALLTRERLELFVAATGTSRWEARELLEKARDLLNKAEHQAGIH